MLQPKEKKPTNYKISSLFYGSRLFPYKLQPFHGSQTDSQSDYMPSESQAVSDLSWSPAPHTPPANNRPANSKPHTLKEECYSLIGVTNYYIVCLFVFSFSRWIICHATMMTMSYFLFLISLNFLHALSADLTDLCNEATHMASSKIMLDRLL